MTCRKCPCPDICLQRPAFCAWAAKEPQHPIEMKAICGRSKMERGELPSAGMQVGNALKALSRVAGAVMTGKPVYVSQEERNRRLAICEACQYFVDNRCRKCGCFALAKIELATEKCPIDKWLRSESGGS